MADTEGLPSHLAGATRIKLRVNRAVLDLFREQRISHKRHGAERIQVGDILNMAPDCAIEPYCDIMAGLNLPRRMGAFSYTGSLLWTTMEIGRYCSIGTAVDIIQTEHPLDWATTSPFAYSPGSQEAITQYWRDFSPDIKSAFPFDKVPEGVRLGNDVWVGQGAMFTRGVTVGDGAVIGARSVVTRDVPAYAIVGGAPATVKRMRFPEHLAQRLQTSQWWRYGPDELFRLDPRDPVAFLDRLEARAGDPPPSLKLTPLTGAQIMAAARR